MLYRNFFRVIPGVPCFISSFLSTHRYGLGNGRVDGVAIRADGSVQIRENRFQRDGVRIQEGSFEKRLGNLKADEIVVRVRLVAPLGNFQDIESKLRLQVGRRIVFLRLPTPKGGGFFGVTKQHGCSSPTMFPASR